MKGDPIFQVVGIKYLHVAATNKIKVAILLQQHTSITKVVRTPWICTEM